ncbi:hypothetical protein ACP70R_033698 [Stipagrostis hirtigluma subsp. patula]
MASMNSVIRVFFFLTAICAASAAAAGGAAAAGATAKPGGAAAKPGGASQAFDITKLGAAGDGKTDCTMAVMAAWKSACEAVGGGTVLVPKGSFLVGPLDLKGPCKGEMTFQVDGTLLGSNDLSKYVASWIEIKSVDKISITGSGTLDGQGTAVYKKDDGGKAWDPKARKPLPNSLVLFKVNSGSITGIKLLNSKFFHINVDTCKDILISDITITAPGDSLNTDGIHVGMSTGITIENATIGTGDDCVSVGAGSSVVVVNKVTCGPGQGISVGCLGRYKDEKDVTDVTVKDSVLRNTTFGLRIKSFEEAEAALTASRITFENIRMDLVANPIIIDQYYCPEGVACVPTKNAPTADTHVSIKDVTFRNITGTSSTPEAVSLLCSKKLPCSGVELIDVNVKYAGKNNKTMAVCNNAKGVAKGSIDALRCLLV